MVTLVARPRRPAVAVLLVAPLLAIATIVVLATRDVHVDRGAFDPSMSTAPFVTDAPDEPGVDRGADSSSSADGVRGERSAGFVPRVGTPVEPLRVAVFGDSVALTARPAVTEALRRLAPVLGPSELLTGAAMGFGFTSDLPARMDGEDLRPLFPAWWETFAQFVDEHDPDLVIVMAGTWDVIERRDAGRWRTPLDPDWSDWYESRIVLADASLAGSGAAVVWLTEPCTAVGNDPGLANEVLREWAQRTERPIVDLDAQLCPRGAFSPTLALAGGDAVVVRGDDGVHLTDDAASVLGPTLATDLQRVLEIDR